MTITKPVVNAIGLNGNTLSVLGAVKDALVRNGMRTDASEVQTRVWGAKSYDEALAIMTEYVEFEFGNRAKASLRGAEDNQILPAGKYIVADPCYILDDRIYYHLLGETEAFSGEATWSNSGMVGWIHHTTHGDGAYHGSDGKTYHVDSGHLSIISVPETPDLYFKRGWEQYPTFAPTRPFTCTYTEDGELAFGEFLTIPTDGEKCDDCGGKREYCECDNCGGCTQYGCSCSEDDDDDND